MESFRKLHLGNAPMTKGAFVSKTWYAAVKPPNLLGHWEHPAQMWYHSFCFILLQCTVQGNHSIATSYYCRVSHAAQINWAPRRTVAALLGCLALVLEICPTPGPQDGQWTTERRRWTRPNLFKVDSEKTGLAKIGSREMTVQHHRRSNRD